MATQAEIWQIARLLGRDEFLNCLSIASLDDVPALDERQLAKVHQCTLDNANRITRALVHEAAGRDDVVTARQAKDFLEQRLAMLGDLLSDQSRAQIREGFGILTTGWGTASK